MNLKDQIQNALKERADEISALTLLTAKLRNEGIELEKAYISFFGSYIDFNGPSRKDVEKLMYFLRAGKWEKTPCGETFNYETVDEYLPGWKLRLWCAEPPGSCKVIEEEVDIPAQPARKEIRKRLECKPASTENTNTTV